MKELRASMSRPAFEDEDQTRIAGFLYTIVLTLEAGTVLYLLVTQAFTPEIPRLLSLILIFVVDVYDALISDRPHRKGWSRKKRSSTFASRIGFILIPKRSSVSK